MKKLVAMFLALTLTAATFVGCGTKAENQTADCQNGTGCGMDRQWPVFSFYNSNRTASGSTVE